MALRSHSGRTFAAWALLPFILVILNAAVALGPQESIKVPDGTTLVVELQQSVRADRVRPGDQVRAKLIAPILNHGQVVLPAGTTVLGVIVEADPLALPTPSRPLIRFQEAHWKQVAADLNAFMTRYLVIKRKYSYEPREMCPPVRRFQPRSQF